MESPVHNKTGPLLSTVDLDDPACAGRVLVLAVNGPVGRVKTAVPGSVVIDIMHDLQDQRMRDVLSTGAFAALCSRLGIPPGSSLVFYDAVDGSLAAYALWVFYLFGHQNLQLLDGGLNKWKAEGRPLAPPDSTREPTEYSEPLLRADDEVRAFFEDALAQSRLHRPLLDVRSAEEFQGKTSFAGAPEPQRKGHIPGARNLPVTAFLNADGTLRGIEEVRALCSEVVRNPGEDVIVYCQLGERSALAWFVLHRLLGLPRVKNYDGAWTEWGNRVRAPVE